MQIGLLKRQFLTQTLKEKTFLEKSRQSIIGDAFEEKSIPTEISRKNGKKTLDRGTVSTHV